MVTECGFSGFSQVRSFPHPAKHDSATIESAKKMRKDCDGRQGFLIRKAKLHLNRTYGPHKIAARWKIGGWQGIRIPTLIVANDVYEFKNRGAANPCAF